VSLILHLQHLSGSLAGQDQRVALADGQVLRLGRGAASDVRFNDSIDDSVSTVHAELRLESGRLFVEDQRSANGTFLNGAPCPPFQRIAVPDGSRLRLARGGPELQVILEPAKAGETKTATAAADSSLPPKQVVGRETLLREIHRAKEEGRDQVASEVARTRQSTSRWMLVTAAGLALLVVIGAGAAYLLSREKSESRISELAGQMDHVAVDWTTVEARVRPAVAHLRCRYLLQVPHREGPTDARLLRLQGGEVLGSAVLIRPNVLLTARHVVQPWKSAFDSWDDIVAATGVSTEYDLLTVQFPGQQPVAAEVLAVAENRDLALLSITDRTITPVPLTTSNSAVQVAADVAILGYPGGLGKSTLFALDAGTLGDHRVVAVSDVQPTFLKGTVTMPVAESGELAGLFFMDASAGPGMSGGPVIDRTGSIIGVISQRLESYEQVEIFGKPFMTRREVGGSVQAVNPEDIQRFLRRAGIL
jgi:pSer/pThr/pTyr-binding forkhead associated (FHA) protein